MNVLQRGDRLVVSELSRLGRSLGQIVAILDALAKAGVAFVAMKENIRIEGKRDIQTKVMTTPFTFLGFSIRRAWTQRGKWGVACVPKIAARTKLLQRLKGVMRRHCSQPVERVIALINPILRGWTNYFRIGQSSRCFSHVKDWVEKKVRRHLMRQRGRLGFGWKRWSRQKLYDRLGLFSEYRVVYLPKALPV